jgi:DNA-binding XRE family transcriptional regulator
VLGLEGRAVVTTSLASSQKKKGVLAAVIGERCAAARKRLGYSQRSLAKATGMSPSWVREYESGGQYAPAWLISTLSEEASLPVGWFYGYGYMADNYNDEITCRTDHGIVVLNTGYEHYKGGLYFVMQVAKDVNTGVSAVVYRRKDTHDVLSRALRTEDNQGWFDLVEWPDGSQKPRFMKTTWFHFMHGEQRERKGKK